MKIFIKFVYLLVFAELMFPPVLFAQSVQKIDGDTYISKRDSLLSLKDDLNTTKLELKSDIDSLIFHLEKLKEYINEEQKKLYIIKYGEEIGLRVASRQIWKGMTENMLRDSWGTPDNIDKNVEKWGVFTQWYFGDITFFFRDSKLTDWEEIK